MKKKIKLADLKVQSFVTALTEEEKVIARGGDEIDRILEDGYCLYIYSRDTIGYLYILQTKKLIAKKK